MRLYLVRRSDPTPDLESFALPTSLKSVASDATLIAALRAGQPGAAAAFYDRYASRVRATLRALLGPDADLPDLLQEVFIRALDRVEGLRDIERAGSWLTTIAVFVARAHLRVRKRRNWLRVFSPERTAAAQVEQPSSDARRTLRELYAILDRMPVDDRMAFLLRHFHGATLVDAAKACNTSLATLKRRLARAEKRFLEDVRRHPGMLERMAQGTKWTTPAT